MDLTQQAKDMVVGLPRRFTPPFGVPEEVQIKRLTICIPCEHFTPQGLCDLCNCPMDGKTMMAHFACPDSPPQWGVYRYA